jgi:hypothetical protein
MQTLPCPSCGLRVLELEGQFSLLNSFYINNDSPPAETAGWWHARCLAESDVATLWYEARLRNFRDVRRYQTVAEYAQWTVMQEPNRKKLLALGRRGQVLSLSRGRRKRVRVTDGGCIYSKTEEMFHFELGDVDLVHSIQEQLLSYGRYPLLDVLNAVGIADKLIHHEALEHGAFLFDKQLYQDWNIRSTSAGVEYGVFVPAELEHHVGDFVR